ncbi:OadG family protein [Poriferisphaera sp. WC338]|uniref:OadG family protein n=1 Tax=Poriferisphaera sp. WC338 TaxID=3425129 RepID=UPI003D819327
MFSQVMTLAAEDMVTGGLTLMFVGMGVVFTALILLMITIKALNTFLAEKPKAVPAPAPIANTPKSNDEIEPEVLAVISAAVAAVVGGSHKIRRVDVLYKQGTAWARQGRRSIMTSHRPKA